LGRDDLSPLWIERDLFALGADLLTPPTVWRKVFGVFEVGRPLVTPVVRSGDRTTTRGDRTIAGEGGKRQVDQSLPALTPCPSPKGRGETAAIGELPGTNLKTSM
jgi:hypothetical protein